MKQTCQLLWRSSVWSFQVYLFVGYQVNILLTIGAPLWPKSFGFSGNLLSSIRQGESMNRGHRKMAADNATNTTAMNNLDPSENKSHKKRCIVYHMRSFRHVSKSLQMKYINKKTLYFRAHVLMSNINFTSSSIFDEYFHRKHKL